MQWVIPITVTLVFFVTRLMTRCTSSQVAAHIRDTTGSSAKPEKLQTKYGEYSSFYVRCTSNLRSTLMNSESWPAGVLVKLFYD